jgi:hypothetical protein
VGQEAAVRNFADYYAFESLKFGDNFFTVI